MWTRIKFRHDITELDILLILLMAWWGMWMLIPTGVEDNRTYHLMFDIASSWWWGLLTVVLVTVKSISIYRCLWKLRMATLVLFTTWWAFIAAMVYVVSPNSPGWGMIAVVALISMWRSIQIATLGDTYADNCKVDF